MVINTARISVGHLFKAEMLVFWGYFVGENVPPPEKLPEP
jgi:hypothetical protein